MNYISPGGDATARLHTEGEPPVAALRAQSIIGGAKGRFLPPQSKKRPLARFSITAACVNGRDRVCWARLAILGRSVVNAFFLQSS